MAEEVTFMDLATLTRITPDTTLEKLGTTINASIYDASNIAGSLKQKGLIDFSAYYPGPTTVTITDSGKALIAEADAKAMQPFDQLDDEILVQLSGGKRIPVDLQNSLSLRPKDLALRIYKLSKQGLLTYNLKSGGADILLTEAGFLRAKSSGAVMPPQQATGKPPQQTRPAQTQMQGPQAQQQARPNPVRGQQPQMQQGAQPQPQVQSKPAAQQGQIKLEPKPMSMKTKAIMVLLLLVIIGCAAFLAHSLGILK